MGIFSTKQKSTLNNTNNNYNSFSPNNNFSINLDGLFGDLQGFADTFERVVSNGIASLTGQGPQGAGLDGVSQAIQGVGVGIDSAGARIENGLTDAGDSIGGGINSGATNIAFALIAMGGAFLVYQEVK